jgi:rhodanese-related sulfurtransferase
MNRRRLNFAIFALALVLGLANPGAPLLLLRAAETTTVRHVDPDGAARCLGDPEVIILDVRTPGEFKAGHLKGARLLDFQAPDFAQKLAQLDRQKTYLLHCASGARSRAALDTFRRLGFKSVVHLDGGLNAWKRAGKPIEQ